MVTIKNIFYPTDLSAESNQALRYAIALACAQGAKLTVCHCLEPAHKLTRGQAQAKIELAINKYHLLHASAPLQWEVRVIAGDPAVDIVTEADTRDVDLIILRSRRRPLAAAIFGSTAEAICRDSPCPVLVTHPDEREWKDLWAGEVRIKRLLAAHDFSANAEAALSYALSLAQQQRAELHLIHVIVPPSDDLPRIDDLIHEANHKLQQAIPDEAQLWCKVVRVLRAGQPYNEVLAHALEHKIELICLGKHGGGGGLMTLFGSNTDRVLRHAPCPVLVTPPLGAALSKLAVAKAAKPTPA